MERIKSRNPLVLSLAVLLATALAAPAGASSVTFTLIQETVQSSGDGSSLFGTPTVAGNNILFTPTTFNAASGPGVGADVDHSLLTVMMEGTNPTDTITFINISEFGDASLTGVGGLGTLIFLQMAGTLTITETLAGPVSQAFTWGGAFSGSGTIVPAGPGGATFDITTNAGSTLWTGTVSLDLTALLASKGIFSPATKATLQYNDQIQAFSEATSIASVSKKAVTGPGVIIEVIPEPATGALFVLGLIALGIRSRQPRV
jgi:hypothetical protein